MRRRQGFTLVELMVSMALIVFIMTILSQAFITATQSFRDLRAAGELSRKLSTATSLLRADLNADHFNSKKRLSDPTFWNNGPPDMGFFRIWQGSASVSEGVDSDGIPSYLSVNHMLSMALKARGNQRDNFYSTVLKNAGGFPFVDKIGFTDPMGGGYSRYQDTTNSYNYQWAEVAWFLYPSINLATSVQDTANGTPLYTLYRRLRVAVPDNSLIPKIPVTATSNFLGVSCLQDPNSDPNNPVLYFNNPIDLTIPWHRFGMSPYVAGTSADPNTAGLPAATVPILGYGYLPLAQTPGTSTVNDWAADAVLFDVVSFDIRVLLAGGTDFVDIQTVARAFNNQNTIFANPTTNPSWATAPWVFDTWSKVPAPTGSLYPDYSQWSSSSTTASLPTWNGTTGPIITAIKITLRVWDVNTNLTRQVTIIEPL